MSEPANVFGGWGYGRKRCVLKSDSQNDKRESVREDLSTDGKIARQYLHDADEGWRSVYPPNRGLAGEELRAALPSSLDIGTLRVAIRKRRHRTGEQRLQLDILALWLAHNSVNRNSLAAELDCHVSTISLLTKRGKELDAIAVRLREELRGDLKRVVEESNHQQLMEILKALGVDVVDDAETVLAEAA